MFKFGTGAQYFPLLTGNNNNPTLAQGSPTRWFLNTIPDRVPTGPLAYVLGYLLLTISGTVVQPASGASVIYFDDLTGALIDSIDWTGSWMGAPCSQKWVVGANMPAALVEMGYLTNADQETQLTSAEYQDHVVQAILEALIKFRDLLDTRAQ